MHTLHPITTTDDQPSAGGVGWSGRTRCQVCQERDGQGYLGGLLVCGACYEEAKHDDVRLWRASLRLIVGGYPR